MSTFDPDTLAEAIAEAPEAGYAQVNFGKMVIEPLVVRWAEKKKVTKPLVKGYKLAKDETLELKMTVDIQEYNPQLKFTYERSIPVRVSSVSEKSDWSEIFLPSLVAVFGEDWRKAISKGVYVQVEDVPNVKGAKSKTTQRVYGVPKIMAQYATSAECKVAHDERFGAREAESNGSFPEEIVTQAKALIQAAGVAKALEMLKLKPYGDFDAEMLLKAASDQTEVTI